jgi:hypothetical protein
LQQNITVRNSATQKNNNAVAVQQTPSVAAGYETSKATRFYLLLRHQQHQG